MKRKRFNSEYLGDIGGTRWPETQPVCLSAAIVEPPAARAIRRRVHERFLRSPKEVRDRASTLSMYDSEFVNPEARFFAARVRKAAGADEQIQRAFWIALGGATTSE